MLDKFVERKYLQVAELIKPKSKVLDMGCDTGELKNFLNDVDYYGADVEAKKVEELKKKGLNIFLKDLNKDKFNFNKKFDYITFLDVLEHLLNPAETINKCRKILNEGGKLIICLPNDYHLLNKIRFLFNKNISKYPFWAYGHLHTFPIKSGKRFLEEQNLRILKSIILYPEKPRIIPDFIKKLLAKISPNNFSRGVIYLARFNNN